MVPMPTTPTTLYFVSLHSALAERKSIEKIRDLKYNIYLALGIQRTTTAPHIHMLFVYFQFQLTVSANIKRTIVAIAIEI